MDIIQTLILAIIQGITEWLPISSSGHLAMAQKCFNIKSTLTFDIALHIGTILVVLVAFRSDIIAILKAVFRLDFRSEKGKLALFIIVGSLPTAIIGFLLLYLDIAETFFSNMLMVGAALLFTGSVLYVSKYAKNGKQLNYLDSLLIGIAQGIATIPGISRSGFTISTGLLRKLRKEEAFKYSFLLSIPAVLGAMVAAIVKEHANLTISNFDLGYTIIGIIASFVTGYIALKLLQKIFMKQKFHLFAYYCWAIGLLAMVLNFLQ